MLKNLGFKFIPKNLLCRHTHRVKDYKVFWKKECILEDWQNFGFRQESLTNKWEKENNDVTDISRLPKFLKNRKRDVMQVLPPRERYETSLDYQRAIYALFGKSSNIDPGEVCWPSPEKVELIKDLEENYEDSITKLMDTVKQNKAAKQASIDEFQKSIRQNIEKLPAAIVNFEKKKQKIIENEQAKLMLQENLKREAREYFGFTIEYYDPRMVKFREMKEMEAKKKKKESKKKFKQER